MALNYTPAKTYSSQTFSKPYSSATNTQAANYQGRIEKQYTPAVYTPPKGTVLGYNTGNSSSGSAPAVTGGGGGGGGGDNGPTGQSVIEAGVQSGNDAINRDYEDAIAQAQLSEDTLNRQGNEAQSSLRSQGEKSLSATRNEQAVAEQGLASQGQTATKTYQSGTRGARDLFRQQQQANIAQTSALGISSSSVSEGLAEKLGVDLARRLAGLTGSYEEVNQNLAKEGARIKTFAAQKIKETEDTIAQQLQSIQSQVLEGVRGIGLQKQMAASAKANARADLINKAQQAIYQLQSDKQNFDQQIKQWEVQQNKNNSNAIKEFFIPQDKLGEAVTNSVSQMPKLDGLQWVPKPEQGANQMYNLGGSYQKSEVDLPQQEGESDAAYYIRTH